MRTLLSITSALLLVVAAAGCDESISPAPQAAIAPTPVEHQVQKPAISRGKLNFVEGYEKGFEQGKKEGKPMLIFFTAEWCTYCHQMADEAFSDEQVVSLSRDFVCILVDYDAEPAVCRQFQVQKCPIIQFLSPRGLPLKRIVGKKPGHVLVMEMQAALQNVARLAEAEKDVTPR